MKKIVYGLAALILACSGISFGQSAPTVQFSAGGDSASLSLVEESDGTWGITPGTQIALGNGITFTLNSVIVNSDPYVFYSYDVTNNGTSATSYTATIPATSANLAAGTYTVSSSLGISLTNAQPGSTVWIAPTSVPGAIQQGLVGGNDAGVDLGTANLSNSTFGSTTTTNYTGGPATYTLAAPATTVSIAESFNLSAGASVGLSGFFDVESVPEPSSVGLALLAAAAFVLLVIRSPRARA